MSIIDDVRAATRLTDEERALIDSPIGWSPEALLIYAKEMIGESTQEFEFRLYAESVSRHNKGKILQTLARAERILSTEKEQLSS